MKIENYETKKGKAILYENVTKIIEKTGREIIRARRGGKPFLSKLNSDGTFKSITLKCSPGCISSN